MGRPEGVRSHESFSLVSPYSSVSKPREIPPLIMGKGIQYLGAAEPDHAYADAPVYE